MTRFDSAFAFTMTQEGGEVTHDPNLTKWGCEYEEACAWRKAHNQHVPTEDEFKKWWTIGDSKPVFLTNYWLPCHCDEIPAPLDAIIFDTAVNMGVGTALSLQTSAAGSATLAKVETYLNARRARYKMIAALHPEKTQYLSDWLGRCNRLQKAIADNRL